MWVLVEDRIEKIVSPSCQEKKEKIHVTCHIVKETEECGKNMSRSTLILQCVLTRRIAGDIWA